jgi:hypothetical protein
MTTRSASASARQQRRRLAQLVVMAGSSVALAVSWLGVVQADRGAPPDATVASDAVAQVVAEPGAGAKATTLVPAPAPVQRQVVIRRSRAS